MVRQLLSLPRQPAVIEMELARGDEGPAGMYQPHADVVAHYRLPTLSWQVHAGALPCEPGGCPRVHPSWPWHQIVADWLAYAWTRVASEASSEPCTALAVQLAPGAREDAALGALPAPQWAPPDGACVEPLAFWDARRERSRAGRLDESPEPLSLPPPRLSPPWGLGEDSKGNGKPGWWADDPAGGRLSFSIRVRSAGGHSNLGLGFLTSFDPAMGAVRVSVEGDPPHLFALLNASRPSERHSVTNFERLCAEVPEGAPGSLPVGIMPLCAHSGPVSRGGYALGTGVGEVPHMHVRARATPTTTATLHVDLVARNAPRNKFVVRYVSTC